MHSELLVLTHTERGSVLEWLNTIMDRILSLLPSAMIIDSTEAGVAYWFGHPRPITPERIYFYWPVFCSIDVRKVVKQCIDCKTQTVLSKDGKSICIGVVVQYRVTNPMKAFTEYDDLDTYIPPLAMSSAQEVMRHHRLAELIEEKEEGPDIVAELTGALKRRLYNSGVEIINVFVNEIAPCRALRLITKSAMVLPERREEDA